MSFFVDISMSFLWKTPANHVVQPKILEIYSNKTYDIKKLTAELKSDNVGYRTEYYYVACFGQLT